MPNMTCRKAIR